MHPESKRERETDCSIGTSSSGAPGRITATPTMTVSKEKVKKAATTQPTADSRLGKAFFKGKESAGRKLSLEEEEVATFLLLYTVVVHSSPSRIFRGGCFL